MMKPTLISNLLHLTRILTALLLRDWKPWLGTDSSPTFKHLF